MASSNPVEKLVSPLGELNWVYINGNPKRDAKGNERYVASLYLHKDSEEFKEIESKIKKFWMENKPKGAKMKSNGIKVVQRKVEGEVDENGDQLYEDTDMMSINFWTATAFPDGKPKYIRIFNARNSEVSLGGKKIGNGSRGAISGAMSIYDREDGKGVTLFLNDIKLTKFVEFAGGDPGFGNDEVDDEDAFEGVEGSFGVDEAESASGDVSAKPRL